jgi:ABC-type branched-subunit amino acid transport system substrate-binding protein
VKNIKVFLSSFLAVIFAYACPCRAQNLKAVELGGIFDLSSTGKIWGNAERDGFMLAIEDFRKQHPELKINFRIEDSAYSNTKTVGAWQNLVNVNKAKAIIGPTWETALVTMPLCERYKILCLAPSYNSAEMSGSKFSFGLWYDNLGYATVLEEELKNIPGKIGIIASQDPYHELLIEELKNKLPQDKILIEKVLPDEQNFKPILQRFSRKISSLVLYVTGSGQFQNLLADIQELKLSNIPLYTDDTPLYLDPKPKSAHLKITITEPVIDADASAEYSEIFYKRFQHAPESPSSAVAYDATWLALNCLDKNDSDAALTRDCLAATQNYKGFSGTISFAGKNLAQGRDFRKRVVEINGE